MNRYSAAVLLVPALAGASVSTVTRGPYLQRPDDATIAVIWQTSTESLGSVEYKRAAAFSLPGTAIRTERAPATGAASDAAGWLEESEALPSTEHRVSLTALAPGAIFEYRILADGQAVSPVERFRAPRCAADGTLAFGVIGDTTGGTVPSALAADLSQEDVDLVLHVGDIDYPSGRLEDYDVNFFQPFAPLLAADPILPILGDHDVRTEDGAAFFEVFDLPANGVTSPSRFYSFRQGIAEFFCLDVESSPFGEDSDQYRWLESELAASTAVWKFVTIFEPPFTSENSNVVEQLVLSPLFERYGVDIVFSGHEHLYERTHPICLSGPPATPVVYVVEGGGGSVLSTFDPESFSAFLAGVYGYVTVRIDGGALELEAHDVTGTVIDSLALVKAAGAAPNEVCPPTPPSETRRRLSGTPSGP